MRSRLYGKLAVAASLAVVTTVVGLVQPASASIFDKIRGGMVTALQDDDFEMVLGNDTIVDVGDVLVAILKIPVFADTNNNPYESFDPTTRMVTGVSLAKVVSRTVSGTNATFVLGPADAADWVGLGMPAPVHAGTMIVAYDDPVSAPDPHIVNTDLASGILSATEGVRTAEFGFRGDSDEFFTAFTSTRAGFDPTNLLHITSLTVYGNMNQTSGPLRLLKHNFLASPGSGVPPIDKPLFTGPAELQIQGTLGAVSPGGFQIATDTDFFVYSAVPEPGSLATVGLLGVFGAVVLGRRRRNAA